MTPSTKSPAMNAALSALLGIDRVATITSNVCVFCKGPAHEFRDEKSLKEYSISGLCMACQDSIFDEGFACSASLGL